MASRDVSTRLSRIFQTKRNVLHALLWADNIEGSFFQAVDWLDTCGHNGIILNPKKFVFGQDTVEFAGFAITPNHVRPCQKYLAAILNFPRPTNVTDIRSWFAAADRMLPFRESLKPGSQFTWTEELNQLFEESKKVIVNKIEHGVQIFDKSKPTCLATDWSKDGIGFWLFQKHCDCPAERPFCCKTGWKITLVGSRFTHTAKSRYAPIEGESLAVVDTFDKARFFVKLSVQNKPLLSGNMKSFSFSMTFKCLYTKSVNGWKL
jgi:hypothetical protein